MNEDDTNEDHMNEDDTNDDKNDNILMDKDGSNDDDSSVCTMNGTFKEEIGSYDECKSIGPVWKFCNCEDASTMYGDETFKNMLEVNNWYNVNGLDGLRMRDEDDFNCRVGWDDDNASFY